jgi:hypothetical protein
MELLAQSRCPTGSLETSSGQNIGEVVPIRFVTHAMEEVG